MVVVVVVVAVAVAVAVVGRGLFGYCMIVSCRLEHSMGRQTTGVGLPEGVTYPLERNFLPQFWCSCSPCDDCPIIPLRTKAFLFLFPSFGIVMSVATESDSPSKTEWKTSRLTAFDQWSFFFFPWMFVYAPKKQARRSKQRPAQAAHTLHSINLL